METRPSAGEGENRGDFRAFLEKALGPVFSRRMLVPAILLTLLLTGSNIVILRNIPDPGAMPPWQFVAAALARIGGLLVIGVAILRILTASRRRPWRPDGAFWLMGLTILAGLVIGVLTGKLLGERTDPAGMLIHNILLTILLAPFAAWVSAIAVEKPLAWRPRPWLRAFRRWLPHLIFWSLLLVTPVAVLHGSLDSWLLRGAGDWFWPVALIDGPLSVVIAILGFSLNAAAYGRVARA